MSKKPLEIDMCAGTQIRDSQGEMLSIQGADISALEAGLGRLNDNHGKGAFNSIGRITSAKKIFKEEDCENDRHKYYWRKNKSPFIYVSGKLYNDEDHPNARAAAAILRSIHKEDTPLKLKASVEGGVIARGEKDNSLLAHTKIHSIALTFTPANKSTLVEPLSLQKTATTKEDDLLIKSVMHLAMDEVPSFIDISESLKMNKIEINVKKINDLVKNLNNNKPIKIKELDEHEGIIPKDHPHYQKTINYVNDLHRSGFKGEALRIYQKHIAGEGYTKGTVKKALMAGGGGAGAPTSKVGGSVMQTESIGNGKRDFKRITCNDCGNDQIMAKDQLKCRGCGKAWNLEKMYDILKGSGNN